MSLDIRSNPAFCAAFQLQGDLDRSALAPTNQDLNKDTLFLDYIESASNRAALNLPDFNSLPENVTVHKDSATGCDKVQLKYESKYCGDTSRVQTFSLADCAPSAACTPGVKSAPRTKYLDLKLEEGQRVTGSISPCDWKCICEGKPVSEILTRDLNDAAFDLDVFLNNKMIAEFVASAGNYADGTASNADATIKSIPMFNWNTNGQTIIHTAANAAIKKNARKAGYRGDYVYFGGEVAADWVNLAPTATEDNGGRLNGNFSFTYSKNVDDIVDPLISGDTSSYILATAPGAFQFYRHINNKGDLAQSLPHHFIGTITIRGKEYDYELYYDSCEKCWTWSLEARYGWACIPTTEYCNPNNAHKMIYKATCGAWDCPTWVNC